MDTSPSELIFLDGTVSAVIYRNEENGYTILRLETTDEGEEVTVVGTMPGINPGEGLSVHGQWTRHSTYGEQFKAEIVERRMPVGEKALLEYLASGAIKGIGAATARRLLDFVSGVAYATGGKVKRVAAKTYIATPYSVDLMGDLIDELENSGLYM